MAMKCTAIIIPTFDDLLLAFNGIDMPALPTFPKPFFGSVNVPEIALKHWIVELQNIQFGAVLLLVWQKIAGFLGLDWEALLPDIPGIALKISDFISGNYTKIVATIKAKLVSGPLPMFPSPLFGSISVPDIEIVHMIQELYRNSIKALFDLIISKLKPVIDLIKQLFNADIGLPTFPTLPTSDEIKEKLKAAFSSNGSLQFPGFPDIPFPKFSPINMPDVQLVKEIPKILLDLMVSLLKPLIDFIKTITQFIGAISFPKLCADSTGMTVG